MIDSLQKYEGENNRKGQNGYEYLPTTTLSQKGGGEEDILSPKKIVLTLWRFKWLILLFLIAGGTGAWFYADTMTPIYESNGTIIISVEPASNDELSNIISQTTGVGTSASMANEMQVLRSRGFSRQIAQKLIDEEPGDNSAFPVLWNEDEEGNLSRASEEAVTGRIRSNLTVERLDRDSDVVQIRFASPSPREAAHIANAAMEIYVERSTLQNRHATETTAEFLEKEREETKQKLQEAEQRLKNYRDDTGIVQVNSQATRLIAQKAEVEAELERIELELQTIEQAISNHEQQLERVKPGLSDQFTEAIGPRVRNAQEQIAQYEGERSLILARNPGVRDREQTPSRLRYLDEQIERLKDEIRELSDQLFTDDEQYLGMENQERVQMVTVIQNRLVELQIEQNQNQSRRQALTERMQRMENDFDALPDDMVELSRLERDVRINEELYVDVSRKYADISVLKQTQFGFGRIIDTALIPRSPVSPNRMIILILGLMLGGVMAIGLIIVRDFFDSSVNSIDQFRNIHLPLLSVVPSFAKVPRRKRKTFKNGKGTIPNEMVMLNDHSTIVSESIRRLKNNIVYQSSDIPPKTMAVTSPAKGDGKSTIVANLGIAFAEEGYKTLLIDCDFRRPKLHTYFGHPNDAGLTNYLSGKLFIQHLVRDTDVSNLKLVTTGSASMRPEVVVSSKAFKQFLSRMEEVYDVILLDTSPFGIISDSMALLRSVNATLIVTKYRKTNMAILQRTLEELERNKANVIGIALNSFDHRKETSSLYGSGYFHALYSSYELYEK